MPIRDTSYRHWEGEFKRGPAPWVPMVRYHLKVVLRQKLLWLLLFGSFVPALVASFLVYIGWRDGFDQLRNIFEGVAFNASEELSRTEQLDRMARFGFVFLLVQFQSFFVLSVTSIVGSRLIARDLRSNALELYLTKPITRDHYLLGKLAVITYFIFLVTFAPMLFVWLVAAGLLDGFAWATLSLLPRLVLLCAAISIVNGSVILALSSLAKSSRYATVIWFAMCFLSLGTAQVLVQVTGESIFSLVSYRDSFAQLVAWTMDVEGRPEFALEADVPFGLTAAVLIAYLTVSIFILRRTLGGAIRR